jgi:hypothetical protein
MNKRLSPDELKAERCGADTSLSSKTLARRLTDDRPPTPGTPFARSFVPDRATSNAAAIGSPAVRKDIILAQLWRHERTES